MTDAEETEEIPKQEKPRLRSDICRTNLLEQGTVIIRSAEEPGLCKDTQRGETVDGYRDFPVHCREIQARLLITEHRQPTQDTRCSTRSLHLKGCSYHA